MKTETNCLLRPFASRRLMIVIALMAIAVAGAFPRVAQAADRVVPLEICANEIDDDGDNIIDERQCLLSPAGEPVSTAGIVPETWDDNPNCSQMGYGYGFKLDGAPTGTFTLTSANGDLTGGALNDSVNTVTVSSDGTYLTWSSTLPMDAVFVKGGPIGGNLYVYAPESTGPDSGLATPSQTGISHVEFCYDYTLTASKTANAEYTREYTWDITKAVDPETHTGWFGDEFESSYDVVVTQETTDSAFKVSGTINVSNPTPFQVTFGVSDVVNGTVASVSCPTNTLNPGASTSCTYAVDFGDTRPADGTNTATIASQTAGVEGATAGAAYAFGEPTTTSGFPTVNVTDYFDCEGEGDNQVCAEEKTLGQASGDETFEYDRDFACPADASAYANGVYTAQFPNVAQIDETGQSDDANVSLTCYMPLVSKTADTQWSKEYTWTIEKSVDPSSHTGFAGDTFDSSYTVKVDQTIDEYGFQAFGDITVTNPSNEEITVDVADAVNGTAAVLDCNGSLIIGAGATASCGYTVDLADNTDGTNTATVTFNGNDFLATAPVIFGEPTVVGYPTINVTDYFNCKDVDGAQVCESEDALGSASGDFEFEYDRPFACPASDSGLYENGVYTASFPNDAEIDETGDSDDANVDLTCYAPADPRVVKTSVDGGDDIGQLPLVFELYDPAGNLVETQELTESSGTIDFATNLETEGTWTLVEVLPEGWLNEDLSCDIVIAYPGSAGETYECAFDNVEKSRVDLVKLTNGELTTAQNWTFTLFQGPDGLGSAEVATGSTPPALVNFGPIDLDPSASYTLCELGIPAGYSSVWAIDTNNDGTFDTDDIIIEPYNPNADDETPEDLGNRCVDINADGPDEDSEIDIPLVPGETLHFVVDNQSPGGAPRTPGYWKNWNSCSNGRQAETAAKNGGWAQGFWLLEDVLNQSVGGAITWDDILTDGLIVNIDSCEVAVDILDKRRVGDDAVVGDGRKVASDPLHNLATHLLAAQLNFGAGACTTEGVLEAALQAESLLDKYNFDGDGHNNLKKNSPDGQLANTLAGQLDDYNNGLACGDSLAEAAGRGLNRGGQSVFLPLINR